MLSRLRHRCKHITWLWAALMLLTFVWQPALSMVGDVHALAHGDGVAHRVHVVLEERASSTDEPGRSDLLHELAHATACCGHWFAMPASGLLSVPVRLATVLPGAAQARFESVRLARVLRPPIGN